MAAAPPSSATAFQLGGGFPLHRCPVRKTSADPDRRSVSETAAAAAAPLAAVTPGTIENGIPAARRAAISSIARPKIAPAFARLRRARARQALVARVRRASARQALLRGILARHLVEALASCLWIHVSGKQFTPGVAQTLDPIDVLGPELLLEFLSQTL